MCWELHVDEDDDKERQKISEEDGRYSVGEEEFENLEDAIRYIVDK